MRGSAWTIGAFGISNFCRLLTNVVLAKLLVPELFGIMVIVNGIRAGIELVSDVGIGQNIVHNKEAEKPQFYNTAWTLRLIRGSCLWLASLAAAIPLARIYHVDILAIVFPVAGLTFLTGALGSVAPYILQKRMQFVRLNVFDTIQDVISAFAHVTLAFFFPSIWALVFGGLVVSVARSIQSYFLLPELSHRFYISREYMRQIFSFGRWVFVTSIIYFLSMNFDRLYYGKVAALSLVGIY